MKSINSIQNQRRLRRFLMRVITLSAPLMLVASLLYLLVVAVLIVLFVDLPRVESLTDETYSANAWFTTIMVEVLLGLWLLFVVEWCAKAVLGHWTSERPGWSELAAVFVPPMRLATPIAQMNGRLWLPGYGWRKPGKSLSKTLERRFSSPMLAIALMILPVLLIEFKFQSQIENNPWLQTLLHICTGLIWFAFTVEFIVMVNATDKRLRYVQKNWIDLAIILLPLISFLRSLRVFRAVRFAKFAKVQQLTKMSRVYRMRGLMTKTLRALMVFEILHRVIKISPERRLAKLEEQVAEKEEELLELRERIASVLDEIKEKQQQLDTTQTAEMGSRDAHKPAAAQDEPETKLVPDRPSDSKRCA